MLGIMDDSKLLLVRNENVAELSLSNVSMQHESVSRQTARPGLLRGPLYYSMAMLLLSKLALYNQPEVITRSLQ
jgi:hypothetical protein